MSIKIYNCEGSRGVRPIWTLEEMGVDYKVEMLPFPPRVFKPEYLEINILGTIPYLEDGDVRMTESVGMCQYFVQKYGPTDLHHIITISLLKPVKIFLIPVKFGRN